MNQEQELTQDIRRPTTSIPMGMTEGIRPSKAHITSVTWNADDSSARSQEINEARELELAEYHARQREADPHWQKIQELEAVVAQQQDQIRLLMDVIKHEKTDG